MLTLTTLLLILNIPFWLLIGFLLRRHPSRLKIVLGNILFELFYIGATIWIIFNLEDRMMLGRIIYGLIVFLVIHLIGILFYAILSRKKIKDESMDDILDDKIFSE